MSTNAEPAATRASRWIRTDDGKGWTSYERGSALITVSPSGKVMRYAPGLVTQHDTVASAKRVRA